MASSTKTLTAAAATLLIALSFGASALAQTNDARSATGSTTASPYPGGSSHAPARPADPEAPSSPIAGTDTGGMAMPSGTMSGASGSNGGVAGGQGAMVGGTDAASASGGAAGGAGGAAGSSVTAGAASNPH